MEESGQSPPREPGCPGNRRGDKQGGAGPSGHPPQSGGGHPREVSRGRTGEAHTTEMMKAKGFHFQQNMLRSEDVISVQ